MLREIFISFLGRPPEDFAAPLPCCRLELRLRRFFANQLNLLPAKAAASTSGDPAGVLCKRRQLQELLNPGQRSQDADRMVSLVAEAVALRHSVLLFCQSRKQCQSCATKLASLLPAAVAQANGEAWPPPEVKGSKALAGDHLSHDPAASMASVMFFSRDLGLKTSDGAPQTKEQRAGLREWLLQATDGEPTESLDQLLDVGLAFHHAGAQS